MFFVVGGFVFLAFAALHVTPQVIVVLYLIGMTNNKKLINKKKKSTGGQVSRMVKNP